jgi:hypothetical protein
MALEPGGRGDKSGNRYEGWWAARQFLLVLGGTFRSVSVERVGDDEHGVDLWVTHNDGTREAQQCKADNRNQGRWPIRDLRARGILGHLVRQLRRAPSNRFTLVSGVDAPELRTMADRAASTADPADFLRLQVSGQELSPAFAQFCAAADLDPSAPADVVAAHDLLRRITVHNFANTAEARRDVEALAEYRTTGAAPRSVVTFLADLAQENGSFDREWHADDLLGVLRTQGVAPRDLLREPGLAPRVEALRDGLLDSIRQVLIGESLIHRPESRKVVELLAAPDAKPIVVIHGRAGDGKSGVLLEVADHLREAGVPFLALRLDRPVPRSSARKYGEELDLPSSPAHCLTAVAGGRRGVLILDQLDAVRWTAAHASAAWEACREVIAQARAEPNLRVVVACRTFDWREDPQFKQWGDRALCEEVEVGPLPADDVQRVFDQAGGHYHDLDGRQKLLLRSPQCLSLWSELQADRQAPRRFRTVTDLMRAFWANRRERIAAAGISSADAEAAIDALVGHMDGGGTLEAPERVLERHPLAGRELRSLNVVTVTRRTVSFAHQSYLDYLVAERVLRELYAGAVTVPAWLKEHDQSLFRREQLRQVLVLLRDEDEPRYVRTLADLLGDGGVRFHLKHLLLQHLGQCDPPLTREADLVARLLNDVYWRDHVRPLVLFKRPAWLEALSDRGTLQALLASDEAPAVDATVWLLWGWAETSGDRVADLLRPYLGVPGRWQDRVHYVVRLYECEASRALFDVRLGLARRGVLAGHDLWGEKLARQRPGWCAELLEARLAWLAGNPQILRGGMRDEDAFPIVLGKHHWETLSPAARSAPAEMWDRLVPMVRRLADAARSAPRRDDGPYFRDTIWHGGGLVIDDDGSDLVGLIALAGQTLATTDLGGFLSRLNPVSADSSWTMQRLALLALLGAPDELADVAVNWVCDEPARLRLDLWRDEGRWELAARLIGRFGTACSAAAYDRLEAVLLAYHEPDEFDSFKYQFEDWRDRGWLRANEHGRAQRALLDAMPAARLSGPAKDLLGQLGRKYEGSPARPPRRDYRMLPVESDVPAAAVPRLSDDAWVRIITRSPQDRLRTTRAGDRYLRADPRIVSGQLAGQARREPSRFARLALRVPPAADVHHVCGLIAGVGQAEAPEVDGRPIAGWSAAGVDELEAVISHFGHLRDREVCMAISGLVAGRAALGWSQSTLRLLARLAVDHPDPGPGSSLVRWRQTDQSRDEDALPGDVVTDSMNHVRSVAGRAIADLIRAEPGRLGVLSSAVERLSTDEIPAVRAAALRVCRVLLRADRERAACLFLAAAGQVGPALCVPDADMILGALSHTHLDAIAPVLRAMAASDLPAVATLGAGRTTCAWLERDRLAEDVERYRVGTPAQRKGVAEVAADWLEDERHRSRCVGLLPALLDDDDAGVRRSASGFLSCGVFDALGIPELVRTFVHTRAFHDQGGRFLHVLRQYPGSIVGYADALLEACDVFATALADLSRDRRHRLAGDAHFSSPLVLRLYEQAQDTRDAAIQARCLDAWDRMLEARVGSAAASLDRIDRY